MSDLRDLSSLSDLSELRELSELSESSALSELAELSGLNELNELTELIGLGELSELGELSLEWVREVSVPFPFPQPPYQPLAGPIGTFVAFRFSLLNRLRPDLAPRSLQTRFKNRFQKRPRQELIFDRFGNRF